MHAKDAITNPEILLESDIQPNGVDIRVDELYYLYTATSHAVLTDVVRQHASRNTVIWRESPLYGKCTVLEANKVYEFETKLTVKIPDNYIGIIHQRSTLSRNGVLITSGIWDSGYEGFLAGQIHTPVELVLGHNVRIAQFILIPATSVGQYSGIYQNKTTSTAFDPFSESNTVQPGPDIKSWGNDSRS